MSDKTVTSQVEFDITGVSDTEAEGEMRIGPGILGPSGNIQTGALVWFADMMATCLVLGGEQMVERADSYPVAVTLNAQVLEHRGEGLLTARASWVKRGRRIATVRTRVEDEEGCLLLDLTSTHMIPGSAED